MAKQEKEPIRPLPLAEHINRIIEFIEDQRDQLSEDHTKQELLQSVKIVKHNFVDAGSLIKVSSFAMAYGLKYRHKGISKQAVYQMIESGKVTPIEIDGVKFVDKIVLENS